jgi:hypothetical protein
VFPVPLDEVLKDYLIGMENVVRIDTMLREAFEYKNVEHVFY